MAKIKSLTKRDLAALLSKGTAISKKDAAFFLSEMLNIFTQALKKEETVQLIPFGTFKTHIRKARVGKNPKTKESIVIQSSRTVIFRPGKFFRNGLT